MCGLLFLMQTFNMRYISHIFKGLRESDGGELPITNRRSVDMHSLEENNGERCLYSRWDCVGTMPTLRPRLYQSPTTHLPQSAFIDRTRITLSLAWVRREIR